MERIEELAGSYLTALKPCVLSRAIWGARGALLVILLCATHARAEESAEAAAQNRAKIFETWGDEWFRTQNEDGLPPGFHHVQSRRCKACGGNDWEVIYEGYRPLSRWVATHRTTLHIADTPGPTLSQSNDAVIDGPLQTAVRLTYGDREIRSDLELNVNPDAALREEFARVNT